MVLPYLVVGVAGRTGPPSCALVYLPTYDLHHRPNVRSLDLLDLRIAGFIPAGAPIFRLARGGSVANPVERS
jgi:hypothetical protein